VAIGIFIYLCSRKLINLSQTKFNATKKKNQQTFCQSLCDTTEDIASGYVVVLSFRLRECVLMGDL